MQYVPPPGVPLVTPTNAGGARAMPLPLVAPPAAPLYMLPLKSMPGQPWYAPLQQMYGPGWTPTNPNPTTTWLFDEDGDAYPAGGQPLPREEKKRRRPPSPQELPPVPVSPRKRPREAVVHDDMRRPAEIAAAAAAGGARPLTTAQALAQKLMAPAVEAAPRAAAPRPGPPLDGRGARGSRRRRPLRQAVEDRRRARPVQDGRPGADARDQVVARSSRNARTWRPGRDAPPARGGVARQVRRLKFLARPVPPPRPPC